MIYVLGDSHIDLYFLTMFIIDLFFVPSEELALTINNRFLTDFVQIIGL